MRQIETFHAQKYETSRYSPVEDGIYQTEAGGETLYVTSLSFVQEPELGEGSHAGEIAQYPLKDLLDEFFCHISDFYEDLNTAQTQVCRLEFAAPDLEDVKKLRGILGKHVCNQETEGCIKLLIEELP